MAKKHNKPTKTCADCIHESACKLWTDGRYISDSSASKCPNHETVEESGAYLCGVLDERNRKKTNADRIRANSDLFMSVQIAGCIVSYLVQCKIIEGTEADHKGLIYGIADDILEWLQEEVEEQHVRNN